MGGTAFDSDFCNFFFNDFNGGLQKVIGNFRPPLTFFYSTDLSRVLRSRARLLVSRSLSRRASESS